MKLAFSLSYSHIFFNSVKLCKYFKHYRLEITLQFFLRISALEFCSLCFYLNFREVCSFWNHLHVTVLCVFNAFPVIYLCSIVKELGSKINVSLLTFLSFLIIKGRKILKLFLVLEDFQIIVFIIVSYLGLL